MPRWLFNIVISIYNSVGKVYKMLLEFISSTNINEISQSFGDLSEKIYVLCGLFMLFRIIVSFLNMLIDPDKVNDKQEGAGAIMKRVVISLVLIILFQPNSIILNPETGLLARIERAVLTNSNSLLNNLGFGTASQTEVTKLENSLSIIFDNVYATGDINCLYTYSNSVKNFATESYAGYQTNYTTYLPMDSRGNIYITFSKVTGGETLHKSGGLNSDYKVSFNAGANTLTGVDGKPISYDNSLIGQVKKFKVSNNKTITTYLDGNKCPPSYYITSDKKMLFHNQESTVNLKSSSQGLLITELTYDGTIKAKTKANQQVSNGKTAFVRNEEGYVTNSKFTYKEEELRKAYENDPTVTAEDINNMVVANESWQESAGSAPNTSSDEVKVFMKALFKAFVETKDDDASTATTLDAVFDSQDANTAVWKLMKNDNNPKLEMDTLLAIIVAIVVIVYLFILCVDVVVRQFKLIVLEIMAPIPIISYIDPKNKVFDEWKKMFISVYIDLFIKIFVINLGTRFIRFVFDTSSNYPGFKKIMVLMGVFVFIKALPNLISKIFGIDASASSFKEIGNVMRRGAGIAVGGVALGATGLISRAAAGYAVQGSTGKKIFSAITGGLSGLTGGVFRGVGAGYSGNIRQASNSMVSRNVALGEANRRGANFWGRAAVMMGASVGLSSSYEKQKRALEDEEYALSQREKQNSNTTKALSSIKSFKSTVEENMLNKSGSSGYEGVAAVDNWHLAEAEYTRISSKVGVTTDEINRADKARKDARKIALNAAIDEELRRCATGNDYDNSARSSLNSYNTYISQVEGSSSYARVTNYSELSTAKDALTKLDGEQTAIMDTERSNLEQRKRELERSTEKASYDAVNNNRN